MDEMKQWRYRQLHGMHVLKKEPSLRMIALDLSSVCNFGCRYCYGKAASYDKQTELLSLSEYLQLLTEAKQFGVECILIIGAHENTLSPAYLPILRKAEELGLFAVTFTNGAAFGNDEIARQAHQLSAFNFTKAVAELSRTSVILKYDSPRESVQNQLVRNPSAFSQIQTALKNLLASKLFSDVAFGFPRFGINSVLTKINYQDIASIVDFAYQNRLVYFCDTVLWSGEALKERKNLELSSQQLRECLDAIAKVMALRNIAGAAKDLINFYDAECLLFDNYFFVANDGGVLPCAGFPQRRLGNIREGLSVVAKRKMEMVRKYYQIHFGHHGDKCPCRVHLEDKLI